MQITLLSLVANIGIAVGILIAVVFFGYIIMISTFFKKVKQGKALVKTGFGNTKVTFKGMWVIPLLHNA